MSVLGLNILNGQFRYALLEGTKKSPILIKKGRLLTTDPSRVPELMDWYESNFSDLIKEAMPSIISYRLLLSPMKNQLITSEFPLGILNLIAYKENIQIASYVPQSFVPSKLGLSKQTDLCEECDKVFGLNPPYWDKNQKNAILVAWFELP